jgi:hypothetical protein
MGAAIALFPEMWSNGYALTPDLDETEKAAIGKAMCVSQVLGYTARDKLSGFAPVGLHPP